MPPRKIHTAGSRFRVSPLAPATFAAFGEVVQNPGTHHGQPPLETVQANQGTATKWIDVTQMENHYKPARRKEARCAMNMFVCRPRKLKNGRLFNVGVMERHPYTPQTFVPMGLSKEDSETAYLVIVAPTLPFSSWEDVRISQANAFADNEDRLALLETFDKDHTSLRGQHNSELLRHRGPPDMSNLRAFVARGDQAVTYAAGTWHAPMLVLGEREVEFVVVQFMNGVAEDDVEEVEMVVQGGEGVEVDVGSGVTGGGAKL